MPSNADRQFLDVSWKRWIAENVLKGSSPDELITILLQNGFSENLARLEVGTACEHPYLDAARSIARQLAKRDWLLDTLRQPPRTASLLFKVTLRRTSQRQPS